MKHPTQQEWMAYLYAELDSKQTKTLADHLESCPTCSRDVEQWQNAMRQLDSWQVQSDPTAKQTRRWLWTGAARWAVAAMLFVGLGIASATWWVRTVETERLRDRLTIDLTATLEPAIRQSVTQELSGALKSAIADSYEKMRAEISEQLTNDINAVAVRTLAVSSERTNEILGELVTAISAENERIRNDVTQFALFTREEMQQTKQNIATLWAANFPQTPPKTLMNQINNKKEGNQK